MNIHNYEKIWLVAAMILIVGFIATIAYGSVALGITMVGDQQPTIAPDDISDDERFGDPRVEQVGENEYEVYAIARTFNFQPDPIEIPAESTVTFYVTSPDVIHSFSVVGTNINTMVIPGEIAELTAEFNETGEYGIICNEYCGANHHDMEGSLNVLPADEFDLLELSADGPDEVAAGDDLEITVSLENRALDDETGTLTLEASNETITEDVTADANDTLETTMTVDATALDEGDHDWTVTFRDHEASGSVTVVDELADDEGGESDE